MRSHDLLWIAAAVWAASGAAAAAAEMNIAKYGRAFAMVDGREQGAPRGPATGVGVRWREDRDVRSISVRLPASAAGAKATVEYWFHQWPYAPPTLPTIEDPADDPWQGVWLKAATTGGCEGTVCLWRFQPLRLD